jgi:cephalosporin-C deacetylase-like acetyl esterase
MLASTVFFALAADAPPPSSHAQFNYDLDSIAGADLDRRATDMAQIQTRAQAEHRKSQVRATVLRLIGGLPDNSGPLHAKSLGTLPEQGFHVERIAYDSLPDFHVTANLYIPDEGSTPHPAVIYTPGHNPAGKLEAWLFGVNMARNGIAVLAYDPIGEGERLQYFDPSTNRSLAGHPTGEHSEASVQVMLTGDHISRYFIWDAMRGIDYLQSRTDIDPQRIGAIGCSGGGTVTAYLAALDSRVKAAGVACYITAFDDLLTTIGPQEAEQSIPNFIQQGLDFPDWVEMAAPTPYAVISTTEDMFPFVGARKSVDESRRIYALYGAQDQLQWITGSGHHGNLGPIEPQIIGFFMHSLEQRTETPANEPLPPPPAKDLLCTTTGQVANSLGGATVFTLNRGRVPAAPVKKPIDSSRQLARFRVQLAEAVRATANIIARPGSENPQAVAISTEQKAGYSVQIIRFAGAAGIDMTATLAIPDAPGPKPATLLLGLDDPSEANLDRLARSGTIVFAPQLVPGGKDSEDQKSLLLGLYYIASLRAFLVGKTLVGLRVDDVIAAIDMLSSRPDVDPARLSAQGVGPMGIVLLHAAVLDPRIRSITLDRTLVSYHMAIDDPAPRDLAQSVIPGVLLHYDLDDLVMAIGLPVTVVDPVDAEGRSVSSAIFHQQYAWVFASNRNLHQPDRLRIVESTSPSANP